MNPFEVLEVPPTASPDEIKAAYHRLAKRWHPDRFSGAEKAQAEERFRLISEAFTSLKDAIKRADLEAPVAPAKPDSPPAPVPPQERTVEDWYRDAKASFDGGDLNRALALVQYALRLDGGRAEFHTLHAKVLDATGGDRKALIKALEHAVRLDPRDIDSTVRLAELYQEFGMNARASALWKKAHDLNPNHPKFNQRATERRAAETGPSGEKQGLGDQFKMLVEQAKTLFGRMSKRG